MKDSFFKKLFNRINASEEDKPNAFLKDSELLEQIEHERAVYLEILQKQLQSLEHRGIAYQTEVEIAEQAKQKKQVSPPARIDALYQESGEIKHVEANIANPPQFDAITEDWDDIDVTLEPFVWNALELHVTGPFPDLTQLNNWFIKWYDIKNRNKANEQGFKSVIHKMSSPIAVEDGWHITIDFGSVSTEALIALYKQCRFNEAQAIKINSAQYLGEMQAGYSLTSTTTNTTINTTAHPI